MKKSQLLVSLGLYILPLAFISYAYSCADVCKKCQDDPTIPGCKEVLASGKCTVPPVTTTTTTSTTTTTLPPPTTTTTTTLPPSPAPTPTPTPNGNCIKQTQASICQENLPGDFRNRVNEALSTASGCAVGSDCNVGNEWRIILIRVMQSLEDQGFCTSFDLNSGDCWKFAVDGSCLKRGLASEMGVRNNLSKIEFYQPITSAKKARWADTRSICRPAKDENMLQEVKVFLEVSPSPNPSPSPSPIPTPSPGICSNPTPGPLSKWEVKIHNVGPNWITLTSTPLVGPDDVYCRAIGYTDNRRYCPPRTEGTDPTIIKACNDLIVGPAPYPMWYWNGSPNLPEGVQHPVFPNDNPYNLLVRPNLHGTASICNQWSVCGGLTL